MEVDEGDPSVGPDSLSLSGLSIRERCLEDEPRHEFHRRDFLARNPSLSNPVSARRCPSPEDRGLEDARALDIRDLDLDEELTFEDLHDDYEEMIDARIPRFVAASETYFCPISTEDAVPESVVKRMPCLHSYREDCALCRHALSVDNQMEQEEQQEDSSTLMMCS